MLNICAKSHENRTWSFWEIATSLTSQQLTNEAIIARDSLGGGLKWPNNATIVTDWWLSVQLSPEVTVWSCDNNVCLVGNYTSYFTWGREKLNMGHTTETVRAAYDAPTDYMTDTESVGPAKRVYRSRSVLTATARCLCATKLYHAPADRHAIWSTLSYTIIRWSGCTSYVTRGDNIRIWDHAQNLAFYYILEVYPQCCAYRPTQ